MFIFNLKNIFYGFKISDYFYFSNYGMGGNSSELKILI